VALRVEHHQLEGVGLLSVQAGGHQPLTVADQRPLGAVRAPQHAPVAQPDGDRPFAVGHVGGTLVWISDSGGEEHRLGHGQLLGHHRRCRPRRHV
jgi:hypothetical protein